MRFVIIALTLIAGGPVGAALAHHVTGLTHALASLAAGLPDPATASLLCGGLGLVAGARRMRSNEVAD